ncbi:hypothetical protein B0F87_1153 [Methylobacter tundripaludum]|uniref:Uncharacterized protein n=1 Tax=Methylobacter tundripaludum TaxID=173365 RepID=A0A2S6H660_9GAMM|nr:hypothetical protein B0F87_1153 [Methylobacter tundripaludum]
MIQTDGFWTMIGILVMVIIKLSKKSFSAGLLRLYWAQCLFSALRTSAYRQHSVCKGQFLLTL